MFRTKSAWQTFHFARIGALLFDSSEYRPLVIAEVHSELH